jgi:hypothetical protein
LQEIDRLRIVTSAALTQGTGQFAFMIKHIIQADPGQMVLLQQVEKIAGRRQFASEESPT